VVFQDQPFFPSLMGRFFAPLIMSFTHKNVGQSAMAPTGCYMQPALVIAADVNCVPTVRKAAQRSNHGE
jgi:hypothetical protein